MKISEVYKLNKKQHELDFIDIDVDKEIPLFLDAYIFSVKEDPWSSKCNSVIEDFFRKVNECIKLNKIEELRKICMHLNEPNETCLGYSNGRPKGAFKSTDDIINIFLELYNLQKKDSNLFDVVKSLSDMKIYIKAVGNDTISDIITNLIRYQLIEYTNEQCSIYNIKTEPRRSEGFWNDITSQWEFDERVDQLIINNKRILLVPKNIVFLEKYYTFQKDHFVQHDVLDFLKEQELKIPGSSLIKYRAPKKDQAEGDPYVTKKDIRKRDNVDNKDFLLVFSSKYPKIMENFRNKKHFRSLNIRELFEANKKSITTDEYNQVIDALIKTLKSIPTGKDNANEYHDYILGVLTYIFYPSLSHPKKETPIDDNKKRIDICYTNTAEEGYFKNLKSEITSNYIYVECKNYSNDVSHPEFDQLAGRFNASSSKVGFLVCREIKNMDSALKKVSAQFRRKKELIIILTDDLIIQMLNKKRISNIEIINPNSHEDILYNLKRAIEVEKY